MARRPACKYSIWAYEILTDGGRWLAAPVGVVAGGGIASGQLPGAGRDHIYIYDCMIFDTEDCTACPPGTFILEGNSTCQLLASNERLHISTL